MSKKRGRPPIKDQVMDRPVTIRLTQREWENLSTYCMVYDVSPSNAIRMAMDVLCLTGI
jgi:hypothetical protein